MSLLTLLLRRAAPGAWAIEDFDGAERRLAEGLGFRVVQTDLVAVATKEQLLTTIAADLGFADWFGHNWDALADALGDWAYETRSLWVLHHDEGLATSSPNELETFIEIASEAFGAAPSASSCLLVNTAGELVPRLSAVR